MRILFLDLDTLRPDHLGCYGYHRDTSPHIDSIAREGVRFSNYFCSDAPCLPSRAALFSGRFGIHTGVVGHGGTAADMRLDGSSRGFRDTMARESLTAFIRTLGLKTVTVSPFGERHGAWWFYSGFNEVHNTGKGGMESAEDITPTAMQWIEANAKQDNWFLHVNYWDPHTPYRAPAEFGNPFENDPLPEWFTEETIAKHRQMVGAHGVREINMFDSNTSPTYPRHLGEIKDMRDMRQFIDGYDCGIRYMDEHIGRILAALDRQGVLSDLTIIISSDHAENLGEMNLYGEHATADGITCHIPMIIRWPGGKSGHVDTGFHYNLDLLPTLAELSGKPPMPSWDGCSYAPAILSSSPPTILSSSPSTILSSVEGRGEDRGRDYLVVSQCAHTCQRGVRFREWMYVRTYHDFYHLFPDEMLFNMDTDPHEQNDLSATHPEICREAVYYLNDWHDRMMKSMPHDVDPLWTVMREGGPQHSKGNLRYYCEFLEKTGRAWAIPELKKKHPREFQ